MQKSNFKIMKETTTNSKIHIGSVIKTKAIERRISATQLGKMINCDSSNIHYIFERESINTDQLWRISNALGFDFFTETYGKSLPDEIRSKSNSETITTIIRSDSVYIERDNGKKIISEYRKITEK